MGLDLTDGRTCAQRHALDSVGATKIKFYGTVVIKKNTFWSKSDWVNCFSKSMLVSRVKNQA